MENFMQCTKCGWIDYETSFPVFTVNNHIGQVCPFCKTDEHLVPLNGKETDDKVEEIHELLQGLMEENPHFFHKDPENLGMWLYRIYADYRDEMSTKTIINILRASSPQDMFNDEMMEAYGDEEDTITYNLKEWLLNEFVDHFGFPVPEQIVEEWVFDHTYVTYPADHYLHQKFKVNLVMDTGDANYDFTLNNDWWDTYKKKYDIPDKSSLLWLAQQMGCTKEDIIETFKRADDEKEADNFFLHSLYREVVNTSTQMNAVTFLFTLSFEQLLDIQNALREGKKGYVILPESVTCGLFDAWNGAGSLFELTLRKDIKIPFELIHSIMPDGYYDYDVCRVYNMCSSVWNTKGNFALEDKPNQ